jgi:hypothetical protein
MHVYKHLGELLLIHAPVALGIIEAQQNLSSQALPGFFYLLRGPGGIR